MLAYSKNFVLLNARRRSVYLNLYVNLYCCVRFSAEFEKLIEGRSIDRTREARAGFCSVSGRRAVG